MAFSATSPLENNFLSFNKWLLFMVLTLLYVITTFVFENIIIDDSLYFQALGEQMAYERIEEFLQSKERFAWLGYLLAPLIIALRAFYTTICITMGLFLYNYPVKFKHVWAVALIGEIIWLLPALLKLIYFSFNINYSLEEISSFYPYSLLAFFDAKSLDPWLVYSIYTVNLLEIVYVIWLIYGLQRLYPKQPLRNTIAGSYILGLLLWVAVVCFFVMNTGIGG